MSLPVLILQIVFWASVLAILYSYAAYPSLLEWLARHRPSKPPPSPGQSRLPAVFAVMAVHNEDRVLEQTLHSIFAADYPRDRLTLLIASDGSTDRSHEIIRDFECRHPNLVFRHFPGHNGKTAVINRLLAEQEPLVTGARDSVIIFCDANIRWSSDLPRHLARHFHDPSIGVVAANILDHRAARVGIADQEQAYIDRENRIKHLEGRLWGRMMGAFGACYAIRSSLHEPVPDNILMEDFYLTMRCYEQGFDGIVDPEAVSWEDVSENIWQEFRRKRRISTGNFQNLRHFFPLFLPWRGPVAFAFWSHKGLRWFGPLFLAAAFAASGLLASSHLLYLLAFLAQGFLFAGASLDALLSTSGRKLPVFRFVRYFYLMNLALFLGGLRFLAGVRTGAWQPTRRTRPQSHVAQPDAP